MAEEMTLDSINRGEWSARHRAVGLVFNSEGQLLLVERYKNGDHYWVFPGGGWEVGETLEQAVVREIKEESSVDVAVERIVYAFDDAAKLGPSYYCLCRYLGGEPWLDPTGEEGSRMTEDNQYKPQWVDRAKISQINLVPTEIKQRLSGDLATGVFAKQ